MKSHMRPIDMPSESLRDAGDQERLRHARVRELGFPVGRYLQPAPMLFTRDGHNLFLGDLYRGRTAFLVCSGPSLRSHDLSLLQQRGFVTLSVNNAATVVRSQLWCSVDDPGNFSDAIWRDPGIMKFVPLCHMEKKFTVRSESKQLTASQEKVGDMPAVFGFRRNESFNAEQWLYEDTFNWGNHSRLVDAYGQKGSRSVMYVALRMLFYLGIRRIYLLGCDFRMESGKQNYAFEQDRSPSSVKGNNSSYQILNTRLGHLKPHFEQEGLEIFNCTPNSGLTAFPYVTYEAAVADVRAAMPHEIITKGMYERQAVEREKQKQKAVATPLKTVAKVPQAPVPTKTPKVLAPRRKIAAKPLPPDGGRKPPSPIIEPADSSNALVSKGSPEFTLLTWADESTARALKLSWTTWSALRPELSETPVVVVHDSQFEPQTAGLGFLNELSRVRFFPCDFDKGLSSSLGLAKARLSAITEGIRTPWYLQLAPSVMAVKNCPWYRPDWFAADSRGRLPTLIGEPIVLSDYPTILEQFNDWADQVDELKRFPRLRPAVHPSERSSRRTPETQWSYFGNTAWVRETTKNLEGISTELPWELLLPYCALRRAEYTVAVDMTKYGWERARGPLRHLKRRVEKIVG